MKFLSESQTYAYEQQVGASPAISAQQDRVRVGFIRTASGSKVLLAVVADGDGNAEAGEMAEIIIDHVYETVHNTRKKDLNEALIRGLEAGNQAILKSKSRVSATVVAIRNNRMHLAHTGNTSAYIVRNGKTTPLTRDYDSMLGVSSSAVIETNNPKGQALDPDDRIVLASDGLTKVNIMDGRPFVNPSDIASYVEGNVPMEAARHLISIAMGRDVDDNVSVIVIQPQRRELKQRRWRTLLAIPLALAVVITLVALWNSRLRQDEIPPSTDYGYAVIISGLGFMQTTEGANVSVGKLSIIPSSATLTTLETTRLGLQSSDKDTIDLASVFLYLSAESQIQLKSVDIQIQPVNGGEFIRSLESTMTFDGGRLLVLRGGGSRTIQISFENGAASILGSGRAIMAVELSGQIISLDCLQGNCSVETEGESAMSLQSGQSVSLINGELGDIEPIAELAVSSWNELCGDCLSVP